VTLVETSGDTTALTLPGITASVGLMLLFFLVNAFGIRFLGRFNQWITWMKLIIPVLTFVLLFVAFHGSNLSVGAGFAPHGGGAVLNAVAVSGIIFAFQGFREGINFGGEARNPQRGIFVAAVASVAITAAVYILLQLAFVGAVNWASLGLRPGEWSGLETSVWASQPLYSALTASGNALLGAFGSVLLIDALISPTGSGWIYMGDGARAAYGMAAQGSLPRLFARVGRRTGVPWPGLVACLVLGCLFFVPFPGWYQLIGYTSATASLTYLAAGPQVLIMRRTAADLHRPFTLPAASLLSPLGFLAAGLVVYWAGFTVLRGVVASFFVAVAIYIAVQAPAQSRISRRSGVALGAGFLAAWAVVQAAGTVGWSAVPFPVFWTLCVVVIAVALAGAWRPMDAVGRRELRSSGWLLGFVMAIYLLSYYGSYGPAAQPALPFPYDTGIAAVITVGFFILAVRAGYETEDLRAERASVPIDPEPRARVGADI
jgi:amino acid transporter